MSTTVTPQYLLEGAVYSLQQCGLLLRDAKRLYQSGSYANAVVLAQFAHEELGKWIMFLKLRAKALAGEGLTVEQIQKHCESHVRKQTAGMIGFLTRINKGSNLQKLHETRLNEKLGRNERKAANEQIEKLNRQKAKRTPDERHKQRMSALYVNPISPDRWNIPEKEISPTVAEDVFMGP
jgi:AbiV family abortive infection protein